MKRRDFHRICGGLLAAASEQALAGNRVVETSDRQDMEWPRSVLMRDSSTALSTRDLAVGDCWVFHYPFVCTPSFLIRLNTSVTSGIAGIGDNQDIVAFGAICSHKMTAPAKQVSHINYRTDPVTYPDSDGEAQSRRGLISCCSERSIFDPADGARVLSGPAPMPLPAIRLDTRDDGAILATASVGRNRYREFVDKFGFRLALEHQVDDIAALAGEEALAMPAGRYSELQVQC